MRREDGQSQNWFLKTQKIFMRKRQERRDKGVGIKNLLKGKEGERVRERGERGSVCEYVRIF